MDNTDRVMSEEHISPSTRTFENYQEEIRKQNFRKTDTVRRNVPKMGRNDECPCCSKKKLKKCGCRVAKMFL